MPLKITRNLILRKKVQRPRGKFPVWMSVSSPHRFIKTTSCHKVFGLIDSSRKKMRKALVSIGACETVMVTGGAGAWQATFCVQRRPGKPSLSSQRTAQKNIIQGGENTNNWFFVRSTLFLGQ